MSLKNSPVKGILAFGGVPRTVVTLGWVSLLTDVSSEMVAAVLPLFVIVQLGLSPTAYGMVEGVYQAGTVIARLAGGYLGDARSPKIVAMTGYMASALCKLLLVFASGFAALAAIVALDRVGKGLRTAPRDAMIAAATLPQTMGRAFGVHRAMDTFGALLGPIAAWALLAGAVDDFALVFLVSFCFALMAIAIIWFLKPEHARAESIVAAAHEPSVDLRAIGTALASRPYLRLLLACAALSLFSIADGFLYLMLARAGSVSTSVFPLLFVGTSLFYLLFAVPLGNLADRVGKIEVFLVGHVFLLVAYLGAGFVGGTAGMSMCLVGLGLYYAATDGVLSAVAAPLLPENLRSTGLSIVQSTAAIGRAMSAILFGLAWGLAGLPTALSAFSVALVLAFCLAATRLLQAPREVKV